MESLGNKSDMKQILSPSPSCLLIPFVRNAIKIKAAAALFSLLLLQATTNRIYLNPKNFHGINKYLQAHRVYFEQGGELGEGRSCLNKLSWQWNQIKYARWRLGYAWDISVRPDQVCCCQGVRSVCPFAWRAHKNLNHALSGPAYMLLTTQCAYMCSL